MKKEQIRAKEGVGLPRELLIRGQVYGRTDPQNEREIAEPVPLPSRTEGIKGGVGLFRG